MQRLAHRLVVPALAAGLSFLAAGCMSGGSWSSNVHLGTFSTEDLESRTFTQSFGADGADMLRLLSVAGNVEIVPATGDEVVVEARVYARGGSPEETRALLDGMTWTLSPETLSSRPSGARDEGPQYHVLSWPVREYSAFNYPALRSGRARVEAGGLSYSLTSERTPASPTLFADLTISLPASCRVELSTIFGAVRGGALAGNLAVSTWWGDVSIDSFDGALAIDTGSGDIAIRALSGSVVADTGSGDVRVVELLGESRFDTGSGDIIVEHIEDGSINADTGSGDVIVRGGSATQVVADTGSGHIKIVDTEFDALHADTGSGDITVRSALGRARSLHLDTGSGDVVIHGGTDASFVLTPSTGSGRVRIGYADVELRFDDDEIVGARRGDGRTVIHADTGSGDVSMER